MKASSNQIFDAAVKFIAAIIAGRNAEFSGSVGRLAYPDVLQAPQLVIDDAVRLAKRVAESVEDDSVMTLSYNHIMEIMVKSYKSNSTKHMPMTLLIENVKALDNVNRDTAVAIVQRAEQLGFIKQETQGKKTVYTFTTTVLKHKNPFFEDYDDPADPF